MAVTNILPRISTQPNDALEMQCPFLMNVIVRVVLTIYLIVTCAVDARAMESTLLQGAQVSTSPTRSVEESVGGRLEHHLQRMVQVAQDDKTQIATLGAERAALAGLARELREDNAKAAAEFDAVENHLRQHNLPPVALQRHREAIQRFEQERAAAEGDLTAIETAADMNALRNGLQRLKSRSHLLRNQRQSDLLDLKRLPFSVSKPTVRAPRASSKDYAAMADEAAALPIKLAAVDPLTVAAAPLTDATLAPTEDVQITPEIQALAAQLGHNPVEIHNWVYHNISFVPTYGSIQGSIGTLQTRRGNAFDTSSLLLALLRASGIRSRYVVGTVEMPIDKVMNWLGGLQNPQAATDLLAQGGIPVIGVAKNGTIVAARLEHVWVEAFVDFAPSRGARNISPDSWVPMDASYKQYTYASAIDPFQAPPLPSLASLTSLQSLLQFDASSGRLVGITPSGVQAVLEEGNTGVQAYFDQALAAGQGLTRERLIDLKLMPYLAAGLPYQVVASSPSIAVLPSSVRRAFQVKLYRSVNEQVNDNPALSFQRNLTGLSGKRLSLEFQAATADDRATIDSFLPAPSPGGGIDPATLRRNIPGYLVRLNAVLLLDGVEVARANDFVLGQEIATTLSIQRLTGEWHTANNVNTAGEYLAISLNLQGIGDDSFEKQTAQTPENLLHQAGRGYWGQLDQQLWLLGSMRYAAAVRQPSFGVFSTLMQPVYRFGIPMNVQLAGTSVDVDASLISLVAFDGDRQKAIEAVKLTALIASNMEHEIPQAYLAPAGSPSRGASSISALAQAVVSGQAIFHVSANSLAAALPLLQQPQQVLDDIQRAVANGYNVLVSQAPVAIGTWRGSGYIIEDPLTGSGAYRISGGQNGGSLDNDVGAGLAMIGLGALNIIIPPAAADTGDCGQKDRHQFDWKTFLAIMLILMAIAALLAATSGSGGVLAPAAAKVISALILAVSPIAAALAGPAGSTCATFFIGTSSTGGFSMAQTNAHIASAIGSTTDMLTYTGPDAELGSRGWYWAYLECNAAARAAYAAANGTVPACDEYPFYRTWEGGHTNYLAGKVSIRLVDFPDNGVAGAMYGAFLAACRINKSERFRVVPVSGTSHATDKNGRPCL